MKKRTKAYAYTAAGLATILSLCGTGAGVVSATGSSSDAGDTGSLTMESLRYPEHRLCQQNVCGYSSDATRG